MADGTEMTVFLKRTCLGLTMLYLDCSPDRGRSGTLSHRGSSGPHPGSTQLPPAPARFLIIWPRNSTMIPIFKNRRD